MAVEDDELRKAFRAMVGKVLEHVTMHEFITDLFVQDGFFVRYGGPVRFSLGGRSARIAQSERARIFAYLTAALGRPVTRAEFLERNRLVLEFAGGLSVDIGYEEEDGQWYEQFEVAHPEFGKFIEFYDEIAWFPPVPPSALPKASSTPRPREIALSWPSPALSRALDDVVGSRISMIEMRVDETYLTFETGLNVTFRSPATYGFGSERAVIEHGERVRVFDYLAKGYGQDVTTAALVDGDRLRIAFENGLSIEFADGEGGHTPFALSLASWARGRRRVLTDIAAAPSVNPTCTRAVQAEDERTDVRVRAENHYGAG